MLKRRGRSGPPVVSDKDAREIIARLKAGKSSLKDEAQRIGCYHATVRRSLRAVLGSKNYAKLLGRTTGKKSTPKPKAARSPAPVTSDRSPSGRKRYPKTAPTFGHVAGDFCCGRCGSDHLKPGTDGNGGGVLWCACGWSRAIPRVRVTVEEKEKPAE